MRRQPFLPVASLEDATVNFESLARLQWVPLTYQNAYADFGSSFQVGQCALDGIGFVHLRGLVAKSSAWAAGDVLAILPTGFRPASIEMFAGFALDGTVGAFVARVDVYPNGNVVLAASAPTIGSPAALGYLSVSGITFKQGG